MSKVFVAVLPGSGVRLFDHLAGTPAVLGNPTVIPGVGVTHLRYPVRKAQCDPTPCSPGGELHLGEMFTPESANDVPRAQHAAAPDGNEAQRRRHR